MDVLEYFEQFETVDILCELYIITDQSTLNNCSLVAAMPSATIWNALNE